MALTTANDWKAFAYALAYTMEKESAIRFLMDDTNHDGSVPSVHSSVVDSIVTKGGADPADVRAFADLYTAWRQNTKDARGSFSVNPLPAYGAPLSKFNSGGNI